jgi:ligand-binding sensor domain-containing protein/serine phosphatase RsbU (regulator of sigma subunit)
MQRLLTEIYYFSKMKFLKHILVLIIILSLTKERECQAQTADYEPIILESGDTLQTGVPILAKGKVIHRDSVTAPVSTPLNGQPKVVPTNTNVHKVGEPKIVEVPLLGGVRGGFSPNLDSSNFVLVNSTGDTIPTGIAIPTKGKVVPTKQPQPIPALPPRFKDNTINNMQYLDVDQGMPSSYVWSILEDKSGNIWFGTYGGGVSKYDGESFTHYTEKEGLSSNRIQTIVEDKSGNIWFGTNGGGVSKYDGETFTHYTEKEGLSNNNVWSILEDKSGNLWFGTNGGGVSKYDPSATLRTGSETFTHYTEKEGLSNNNVRSILEDKSGNLWFVTNGGGVSKYDGESFTHYTEKEGLSNNSVWSILEDKSGNLWFGTYGGGVSKYDPSATLRTGSETFTHYTEKEGLSNNYVMSILEDKSGNLWFGTYGGGVSKYDGESFTHYTEKEGLSNNSVWSILEDKSGSIWFGTYGGGVSKYDGESFTHYTEKEGLSNNTVRSILEDKSGNLWFGTNGGGVSKYDPSATLRTGSETFTHYTEKEGLSNNYVRSILEDKSGNLWFGTYGGGVSKYDGETFTHYTEKEGLSNNYVRSILEDQSGNLWFGTDGGGVSKYDGESFTHYTEKEGLSNNTVWSILEDKSGNLWFGTNGGGVSKYDPSATLISGSETFTHYTEKEGLSNNTVWSILEDKSGNIWLSTESGLTVFEVDSPLERGSKGDVETEHTPSPSQEWNLTITTFGKQDGLKGVDFFFNSAFIDSKNRIWWGSGKSLTMLDMNQFALATKPPVMQMNRVEINEEFLDYRAQKEPSLRGTKQSGSDIDDEIASSVSLPRNDVMDGVTYTEVPAFSNYPLNLELPYDRNHLTFYYSAIDWHAAHKIQYSYKIEGLNDNWSETTTDIKADYRNLPYGSYTFKVRAIGQSQDWSAPFEYSFTIFPPWWHTWWARVLYGVLAVLSIWLLVKMQTKRLKQRQVELENEVDLATEEVKSEKAKVESTLKEVEQQKEVIEEVHKEITDSINYAERIQFSFLATKAMLDENLGEHFVFFRPKDVVSGDFYWADKLSNGNFAIVNADSTGHGVPGAIMSILNITAIEKAVDVGITNPTDIFNQARTTIIERLKKDGSEHGGKDGMDASILVFNPNKTKMFYTAAQNPIWIIREKSKVESGKVFTNNIKTFDLENFNFILYELRAEKMPVGKHDNDHVPFVGGEFDLQKGDQVYTLTDGFQDQFGGPKGKKFMIKKMREYVLSISHLPMQEQYQKLDETFSNWKADLEQIDDVCVIGVKI